MSKWETSAYSPDEEVESCIGKGGEEEINEGEDEGDKGEEDDEDKGGVDERTLEVGSSRSLGDRHTRPFILPKMWTVNDFLPMMIANTFKNLRDRYQIPDHIPIRLPGKFEKCYSRKTAVVGMYDAMFSGTKVATNGDSLSID